MKEYFEDCYKKHFMVLFNEYFEEHSKDFKHFKEQLYALSEHEGYAVNRKTNKTTGEHYSQKGHQISDMRVTILEKIFSSGPAIRKEREKYFIGRMNTKHKGLNKIT